MFVFFLCWDLGTWSDDVWVVSPCSCLVVSLLCEFFLLCFLMPSLSPSHVWWLWHSRAPAKCGGVGSLGERSEGRRRVKMKWRWGRRKGRKGQRAGTRSSCVCTEAESQGMELGWQEGFNHAGPRANLKS